MKTVSPEEFKKMYGEAGLQAFSTPTPSKQPSITDRIAEFSTGAVKGFTRGAIQTARLANMGAEAINPSLKAVGEMGLNPLSGEGAKRVDEEMDRYLTPETGAEKAGDIAQLIGSVLYPTSKAPLVGQAASKVGASFEGLGARIKSIPGEGLSDKLLDALTGLDDKTKTALSRTPQDVFQKYVDMGRAAMKDDRNRTPLEYVGDKVIDALKQVKDRTGSVGQAKSQIMEQAKIGYNKVGKIAQQAALDIQKSFSGMKLDPADSKIVDDFKKTLMKLGDNPSLRDVDATIDLLQDRLYKAQRSNAVEITDRITGKLRSAVGKLNSQVKQLGGQSYARLNDEYSDLADTVRELNARLGKEGSSAGSLVKRLFSPSDARTKALFDKLEQLTGQDLFRDARLAKFVMEALDDTRAKSLLEEIPNSTTGVLSKALDFAKKKIADPIRGAERFIERNLGGGKVNKKKDDSAFGALAGGGQDEEGNPTLDPVDAGIGMAIIGSLSKGTRGKMVAEIREHIARMEKRANVTTNKILLRQLQKAIDEAKREIQKLSNPS